MAEKHPFDVTREKAGELITLIDEAFAIIQAGREKGLQHGPFSGATPPQLNSRTFDEWLIKLKADLLAVHGTRVRSRKQKELFQALFRFPVRNIGDNLQPLLAKLRGIRGLADRNLTQAAQVANNFYGEVQNQINQINAASTQVELGLPHVIGVQAKPEPFLEAADRLQEIEAEVEAIAKKLEELEQAAEERVELINEHLPRAEELAKEIQELTALLARDLAADVDAETMPLQEAIKLLGERLTALRKLLEERSENAGRLEAELQSLQKQAQELKEKADKLLARSEEVLGHAEGTGLAKWFKQAQEEYTRKLFWLRLQFHAVALVVGVGTILYVIALPFLLTWLEAAVREKGWDGNLLVTFFTRLTLAAPVTIAFFYLWRIYNEYATTERLAHRYRHWQALGASLGGFRMLSGEGDLSDELTAATFLSVVEDPLKGRPTGSEELGFVQRLLGLRLKRKTREGEEELEAGVIPKEK